ncbi:MAG: class I SAM-dependent methyltransferase [Elusimicrobia bacterium]|nr:class I SAM-dependent methyltransferase [Elusimicrobiota bacterium]
MKENSVPSDIYTRDYYKERCGGVEFFDRYGAEILKPEMERAVRVAEVKPGMQVLDMGCGRGELLARLLRLGARVTGMDYSPSALTIARQLVPEANLFRADAKQIPLPDHLFDRVFLLGVFEHLHRWELQMVFLEIRRVLKPGGWVIVNTCTNRWYYKTLTHPIRRAGVNLLRQLGVYVRPPLLPRSEEDTHMHINEQNYVSFGRFFSKDSWHVRMTALANPKLFIKELYGEELPMDFPLQAAPEWGRKIYLGLFFRGPLKWFLARNFLCVACPADR